ncbi:MAG TPA: MlaD family protein [Acetobacteraceae bacterium]|nr:MlaD family protein [Acetobacteraceae bacterium]
MIRLRHSDEWVGLLVVGAFVLFIGAVLEVGLLRDWFRPTATLRIVLPAAGVSGLAAGADVEVLGIRAGVVRRLVIQPDQQMYAEAAIDEQAQAFIRRDSQAVIRRRFGIAGAAYIDISHGTGTHMDWHYAVIDATTERAPTESVGAVLDEVRAKVFPILDETHRTIATLATIAERIEKGEGSVGRLVSDDTAERGIERSIAGLNAAVDDIKATTAETRSLAARLNASDDGVPALLRRINTLLANMQTVTRDIAQTTPRFPKIARNAEGATADLPALLTQTQIATAELEKLLTQMRGMWLLGGGGTATSPEVRRLPTNSIQP